ncbi:hypothetical protein PINS_up002257 [Pythium insidiosum]|nr:hypothetical protein PINS_up002257 [Pythium insidiosum]
MKNYFTKTQDATARAVFITAISKALADAHVTRQTTTKLMDVADEIATRSQPIRVNVMGRTVATPPRQSYLLLPRTVYLRTVGTTIRDDAQAAICLSDSAFRDWLKTASDRLQSGDNERLEALVLAVTLGDKSAADAVQCELRKLVIDAVSGENTTRLLSLGPWPAAMLVSVSPPELGRAYVTLLLKSAALRLDRHELRIRLSTLVLTSEQLERAVLKELASVDPLTRDLVLPEVNSTNP